MSRRLRAAPSLCVAAVLVGFVASAPPAASGQTPVAGDTATHAIPGTDISFRMAFVPGATFVLGSPESELGRDPDEGPRKEVTVGPFWIGVHEVTHDEYAVFRFRDRDSEITAVDGYRLDVDAVSRPSPPYEDPAHGMGQGRHPAVGMTWIAAMRYARWLSEKTGRLYRLPTEAEWELACRAGGDAPLPPEPLTDHAWFAPNGDETHHVVGGKLPNALGLHDMHGNVAEWTLDEYRASFYGTLEGEAAIDPWAAPGPGGPRTVRGGAFDDAPEELRCSDRVESTPRWQRRDPQIPKSSWWNTDSPHVGFRLVSPAGDRSLEAIRAYWVGILGDGG